MIRIMIWARFLMIWAKLHPSIEFDWTGSSIDDSAKLNRRLCQVQSLHRHNLLVCTLQKKTWFCMTATAPCTFEETCFSTGGVQFMREASSISGWFMETGYECVVISTVCYYYNSRKEFSSWTQGINCDYNLLLLQFTGWKLERCGRNTWY